jgi:hypothetical protein
MTWLWTRTEKTETKELAPLVSIDANLEHSYD